MDLLTYIKRGEEKAGGRNQLAALLNVHPERVTAAKGLREALRDDACVILAQLIGENPLSVIAASKLIMEKHPERRAVWLPFVQEITATINNPSSRISIL